jgi:hypothetical protein
MTPSNFRVRIFVCRRNTRFQSFVNAPSGGGTSYGIFNLTYHLFMLEATHSTVFIAFLLAQSTKRIISLPPTYHPKELELARIAHFCLTAAPTSCFPTRHGELSSFPETIPLEMPSRFSRMEQLPTSKVEPRYKPPMAIWCISADMKPTKNRTVPWRERFSRVARTWRIWTSGFTSSRK